MSLQARGNVLRENKENQKRQSLKPGGNNGKRNVLGTVTNQVRRQPLRAAKDKHTLVGCPKAGFDGQENAVPTKGTSSGFAIFEDCSANARVPPCNVDQPQSLSCQDVCQIDDAFMHEGENILPESIVNLHRNTGPIHPGLLQPLHIDVEDAVASPMAVDSLVREPKEQPRDEFGLDPYAADIYTFMKAKERVSKPGLDFMSRQTDVTMSMRNILVDWLVEVGEEYKLHRETLFLSISYIDKFLSLVRVERPKLQLVGAASMFIAAKYEEIYPPDVGEFVYITDDTYTKRQVLKMESVILKLLEFKVSPPTVNWFCERFLGIFEDMSEVSNCLSYFLTELTLIEAQDFMVFWPSMIAASAICLARKTLDIHPVWPSYMEEMSGYSLANLFLCVRPLHQLYSRVSSMPQQAVIEKYKQDKFSRISFIPPPSEEKLMQLL